MSHSRHYEFELYGNNTSAVAWAVKVSKIVDPSSKDVVQDIKRAILKIVPEGCQLTTNNIKAYNKQLHRKSQLNERYEAQFPHVNRPDMIGNNIVSCLVNKGDKAIIGSVIVTKERQEWTFNTSKQNTINQRRKSLGHEIGAYYPGHRMLGKNAAHRAVNIQYPLLEPGDAMFFDPRRMHYGPVRYGGSVIMLFITVNKCNKDAIFKALKSRKRRRNSAAQVTADTLTRAAYAGLPLRWPITSGGTGKRVFNVVTDNRTDNTNTIKLTSVLGGTRAYITRAPWIYGLLPSNLPIFNVNYGGNGELYVFFRDIHIKPLAQEFINIGFRILNESNKSVKLRLTSVGNNLSRIKKEAIRKVKNRDPLLHAYEYSWDSNVTPNVTPNVKNITTYSNFNSNSSNNSNK